MVAVEPMLQLQSYRRRFGGLAVYHGVVGLTYDMLFGVGFDAFDNIGVKFRPIGDHLQALRHRVQPADLSARIHVS